MSSPVHNDLDKRSMYAPPWARETEQQPPQAILAAIERLRQERLRSAAPSTQVAAADEVEPSRDRHDDRQQELPLTEHSNSIDIEAAMAETVRAAWTPPPIEPVTMPEPPKPRLGGPTWGMVVRPSGAIGFAAIVALFVAGVVPLPAIDISLNSDEGAKAASAVVQAFGSRGVREPRQPLPVVPVAVADASPPAKRASATIANPRRFMTASSLL